MIPNYSVFSYAAPYYADTEEQKAMKEKYPSEKFVSVVSSGNIYYAPCELYTHLRDHNYPSRTLDVRGMHVIYSVGKTQLKQLQLELGFKLQGPHEGHYEFMQWGHALMTGPTPADSDSDAEA